ncbi:chemotaxis protein CheA [Sulfurimonas sp.]|nr:chemotaxis protein CheA [Sulfurimonas sp.]
MNPLLEQFLSEARENLAFIDQNIEGIGGDDPELLNSIFRAAHTLKGGSGIVGFLSVQEITHHAEDLLDMLRADQIPFVDGMTDSLYNAFDEVLNLIEAAEETGDIVDADEDTVEKIVLDLKNQMGKEDSGEAEWNIPFILNTNPQSVINLPFNKFKTSNQKINLKNSDLNEEFCQEENFYALTFDIDESCMVYGNDPVYTLTLLGDKVLGIYSCMSADNAKEALSGTEDEDGLLLKIQLTAFVYATYEEIEDSLFNFIDELSFTPLDVLGLLSVDSGDSGHKLDSLKELSSIAEDLDLESVISEVKNSMELVGSTTLQHAQLKRFLDISSLIKDSDLSKLNGFFENLYKGEVYIADSSVVDDTAEVTTDNKEGTETDSKIELNESNLSVIKNIQEQQLKAIDYVESDEDLQRVISILDSLRNVSSDIPSLTTKEDIKSYLETALSISTETVAEEVVVEETVVEEAPAPVEQKDQPIAKVETMSESNDKPAKETKKVELVAEETKKAVVGKTVKIEQNSIDSLMNVVGELLVAKNSLPYLADNIVGMTHEVIKREIMDKYIFINRLSEQLQDLIMGMRMLPVSYVFDRYPKLVRDISKKLGKKVKLEMEGGETKLDKNMIEMLADPMIHIMRNSLDHGIEMPDEREKKGKTSSGNINLKAYAQSDKIIIEIIDDGAGINVKKVANKVLEKGLMTSEQIDALSEDEMSELVLLPGLSTADEITEFSGRGVGMDVVKKSIEGFGGSINIKTKSNQGTVITLAIPMSLAVTSLLHIQMNDIHYGLPMDSVSETVKLEREEIEYLNNEPFVYIRGEVIPLLFIKSMLNEEAMKDEPLSIVVLNIKDNLLAVVVNKFLGQLDVVQKPLVGIMEGHPLFSGTALLGNGQIIMSIDPIGLLGISQKLKEDIAVAV